MEHLINEFFDITRYNLQQMQLEVSDTDLSYMLIQLSDEFYPLLERHGNRIALHAADHLHLVCDANKMARVFNNLLKNAITYSTADTVIDITAEESADALTIAFSNEGPTIPAEKLAQLFDKFFAWMNPAPPKPVVPLGACHCQGHRHRPRRQPDR